MNAQLFQRLIRQNILWLLLLPVLTTATVFYFTRNQPRTYQSTATLYTGLASGYSILTDEKNTRVDHQAVDNAFDNLLSTVTSHETMTQVGIRLLARHLRLEHPDSLILGSRGFRQLRQAIPLDLRFVLLVGQNEQVIYQRIDSMAHTVGNNPIKKLLNSPTSLYGAKQIAKELTATRKKESDMLELTYQSAEAAITYATLTELINVFSNRYMSFKSSETNPVVSYYNNQHQEAQRKLKQAEMKMKAFEENHKIINYEEESRGIAATKEDILSQYNEELMKSRAAKASMDALGKRLEERLSVLKTNEELVSKRLELTSATSQLAQARMAGRPKDAIDQLLAKTTRLSEELKLAALKYYKAGNSTESLPQAHLMDEWLTKVLQYEESTARLSTYEKRLGEFNNMAAKFAPLGSTLSQLKRDISVAEKDYLTTLTGLNQAQVRQKNAEMTGPLRLLDAPEFPLQPLPGKRGLLLGAAGGVGLVLALLLILVRYMTDGRLYDQARFKSVTGLSAVAVFSTVRRGLQSNNKARAIANYMLEQLRSTAAIEMVPMSEYRSYNLITVWSTRPKQGKTWVASQLAERYGFAGKRVAFLHPHTISMTIRLQEEISSFAYEVRSDFAYAKRVDQLINDQSIFDAENYDIILLELPDLSETPIPTYLVSQSNLMLLIVSARITWSSLDQDLYNLYRKATASPILPVLNNVSSKLVKITKSVGNPSTSVAVFASPKPTETSHITKEPV